MINNMRSLVEVFTQKSIEISLVLCFLLPPVGILFLFIMSLKTLYKNLKDNRGFSLSVSSFFFLCLFIATVGAAIQSLNSVFFIASVMVIGYWGLYLRIVSEEISNQFKQYRWILIFGGIYNCLIGWISKWFAISPIVGFLSGTQLYGGPAPKGDSRLLGAAYNPNFTVYLILIALAFLLAKLLIVVRNKRWSLVALFIPAVLLLSKGVIDTGSRAGFLAMICVYFLFLLRLNKFIFLFGSIFMLVQTKWLFEIMPRNELVDHSFKLRKQIWEYSYELWQKHIVFGTTPFGFKQEFNNYMYQIYENVPHALTNIPHAHNTLIGFFAEYGALGGIAFLLLLSANMYKAAQLFFGKQNNKAIPEHFLFCIPILAVTGIFDEPVYSPQIAIITIMLLGNWDKYTKQFTFAYPFLTFIHGKAAINFRTEDVKVRVHSKH
jgi:O-antigen ligase